MDTLTHVMIGANLGRAARADRRGLWAFVVAANLPDVDAAMLAIRPVLGFLSRRTWTHSVGGALVLAALFATLLWMRHRDRAWRSWLAVAATGVSAHLAFDLVNAYGVALFHPFTTRRYGLACAFIVDVWMWGILAAGLAGARLQGRAAPSRWALLALVLYTALCWGARVRAEHMLLRAVARQGGADAVHVFPEPFGPHRFRGVVRRGRVYELYLLRVIGRRVEPRGRVESARGAPEVERVRQSVAARRLERFYAAPVWSVRAGDPPGGGAIVEVFDLRFASLVLGWNRVPFAFRFRVGPEGVRGPERVRRGLGAAPGS